MVRFSQLFVAVFAVAGASASSVIDLIPDNFDDIVLNSGKPTLVEFFAPWCGHCKTLAPIYDELAHNFGFAKDKLTIGKVDADSHKDLGKKYGISGFPTLKWFDGKSAEPIDYKSGRDLESLSAFITEKTSIRPKAKKATPSHVEMLTDVTFDEKVGADQNVVVAFTAPWCGHCKALAPVWEKVAADFAAEPNVLVAKVDCESPIAKVTAQRFNIESYPTIKYFPKGSQTPIEYDDHPTEIEMVDFLNKKAGTFRAPGGSLNTMGGVIPSLDNVVTNLRTYGGDKAYTEFFKKVGKVQDKYAEYYSKVAKKMQDNQEYVGKELTRLQNLIKKGGVSPEKLDDMISRSNILNKFKGEEEVAEDEGKQEL